MQITTITKTEVPEMRNSAASEILVAAAKLNGSSALCITLEKDSTATYIGSLMRAKGYEARTVKNVLYVWNK